MSTKSKKDEVVAENKDAETATDKQTLIDKNKKIKKKTLSEIIIERQNEKFLFGWNYVAGTSNLKFFAEWGIYILAALAFILTLLFKDVPVYSTINMLFLFKHGVLLFDYGYNIHRGELHPLEIIVNFNNIQFWVSVGLTQMSLYFSTYSATDYVTGNEYLYFSPLVKLVVDLAMMVVSIYYLNHGSTVRLNHPESRTEHFHHLDRRAVLSVRPLVDWPSTV